MPEYDILDLRLSNLSPDGKLETTLWSRSATDEDYFLHNFPFQGSGLGDPCAAAYLWSDGHLAKQLARTARMPGELLVAWR